MESRPKRKILLLVLSVCIVFSAVFAETVMAESHEHDCIGEGCPVCLQIEAANNFLKALKLAICFIYVAVLLAGTVKIPLIYSQFIPCPLSPVSLKVRFNS